MPKQLLKKTTKTSKCKSKLFIFILERSDHLSIGESIYAVAKSKERAVDVGAFTKASALVRCRCRPLRAGEVDERQLSNLHVRRRVRDSVLLADEDLPGKTERVNDKLTIFKAK